MYLSHHGLPVDVVETPSEVWPAWGVVLNQKQLSVDSANFVLLGIKMSAVLFCKTFHVEAFPEILSSGNRTVGRCVILVNQNK